MSSIRKQPNGHYRARYRTPEGRSRSQSFERLEDARRFLDNMGGRIVRGEYVDLSAGRRRFEEMAAAWWETTVKLRPSTRRGYRGHLDRHVLPYFGKRAISAIDYMTVETFIADRLGAGLSPKMVRESVSIVSLVMACAVKTHARIDNPAAGHSIPMPQRKIREGDVLDMTQLHKLVEHTHDPYKPAVWMLALTGMRPAELCGLRVRSVNFLKRTVTISATLMPVHRFGNEPYRIVEGPPKTEAGDRTIPLPEWLCDELAAMLAVRGIDEPKSAPERFLFETRYGNPINRDHFREKVIRPALRAAGLPESIRTYDLRHSHASLLIDLGANSLAVAQRMGHSDPAVTNRVYGHLFEGTQAKLTEQLDQLRDATASVPTPGRAEVVPIANGRNRTRIGHA